MLMAQPLQLRAVSSPSSQYLYSVHHLPQVVQASSRPSSGVISRKPIGILLTLLNATLTRPIETVDSKRLTGFLSPLDATLTKNQGGTTPLSIETVADSTCIQGNLLWFGGCGTALEFRRSIEFGLGPVQGFHFFVQLSQLIVRGRIIRRELHRLFQVPLRVC